MNAPRILLYTIMDSHLTFFYVRNHLSTVVNLLDCDIVENEFEIQSRYYVYF